VIILDTNVLSALMRPEPERVVVEWLDRQARTSIWITSITVFEVQFGLQILPAGKRRVLLVQAFEAALGDIDRRILGFDAAAAQHAADLMAARRRKGLPVELRDTMIAGIVLAQHARLVTRNIKHFADLAVPLTDPWNAV
jgi:predicted nucleic acid-binding protein